MARAKHEAGAAVRRGRPHPKTLVRLSETFKVLGDATRLRILVALAQGEMCVGDIAAMVGLTDSAVSHQLRLMKAMRLVAHRRAGRSAFYLLDDDHVEELVHVALRHVSEDRRSRRA